VSEVKRAVLAVGGWAHPGDDIARAASALVEAAGFVSATVRDPGVLAQTLSQGCDLLVVGACWFAMNDARYTEPQRADHAFEADATLLAELEVLRTTGCPLLALHTAVISFDGAEVWREWLGGTWNWETSWHPEPAPMLVQPPGSASIALGTFEPFTVTDELYQDLTIDATARIEAESAGGQPLAWTVESSLGRSAVSLLGHDARSLQTPGHQELLGDLLAWLLAERD